MKQLFLIDANSIIHRSFHALPPLTAPDGSSVGAIYGLSSILLKLWREDKPDYAAALFDRPEPTFRKKKYKEYKAQRPAAPNELISQIIEAHNLFEAFGVKTFEKPGFEADDLIATLAEKFKKTPDLKVIVLTGDMDTLQLVEGEKVMVRTFKKGITDTALYDEPAVKERYGLGPEQLVDYKALTGDPSDNIKGVPGVGPKTAVEIIKKFGSIESAYERLNEDEKLQARLGRFKEEAMLSKSLVTLERNAPVEVGELEELSVGDNQSVVKSYFDKLGFKTLVARVDGGIPAGTTAHPQARLARKAARKPDEKPKRRDQPIL